MNKLTKEEIIYLYSLVEISKRGFISSNYIFGDGYEEWAVCLNKDNNIWQVYLCERGKKYELDKLENIKDACLKVIWYCSYDKEYMEIAIETFLMEVVEGYSLSDEKINEFKNKYLSESYACQKKKVKK